MLNRDDSSRDTLITWVKTISAEVEAAKELGQKLLDKLADFKTDVSNFLGGINARLAILESEIKSDRKRSDELRTNDQRRFDELKSACDKCLGHRIDDKVDIAKLKAELKAWAAMWLAIIGVAGSIIAVLVGHFWK